MERALTTKTPPTARTQLTTTTQLRRAPRILPRDEKRLRKSGGEEADDNWLYFVLSWQRFTDLRQAFALLMALLLAAILAAWIAYHPASYGKAQSLSAMEAPKTYIIYAVVGAVVGA